MHNPLLIKSTYAHPSKVHLNTCNEFNLKQVWQEKNIQSGKEKFYRELIFQKV